MISLRFTVMKTRTDATVLVIGTSHWNHNIWRRWIKHLIYSFELRVQTDNCSEKKIPTQLKQKIKKTFRCSTIINEKHLSWIFEYLTSYRSKNKSERPLARIWILLEEYLYALYIYWEKRHFLYWRSFANVLEASNIPLRVNQVAHNEELFQITQENWCSFRSLCR